MQREPARWRGLDGTRRRQTLLRRADGRRVNPQRVSRLCRALGLPAVIRRRHPPGRFGTAVHAVAPHGLDRPLRADVPHAQGVTDIPDPPGRGRPDALSVLWDLFHQEGVAYPCSTPPDPRIVLATVAAAGRERGRPGLLLPSDPGVPDTTRGYRALLRQHGGVQSLSRRGHWLDHACIEGFFGHLQSELPRHHQDRDEHTLAQQLDQSIPFDHQDRDPRG